MSETPCPVCPQPRMLLVPPRGWLVKPRSRSACVFTCLTWRKSAVCQSDANPPRHSLLFFCLFSLRLSAPVCFGWFLLFCFLFFWVNKGPPLSPDLPPSLALSSYHCVSWLGFLCCSLSQFNSLSRLFFLLNLGLPPLSCCFHPP